MSEADSRHISVLGREAVEFLAPREGGVYVADGTFLLGPRHGIDVDPFQGESFCEHGARRQGHAGLAIRSRGKTHDRGARPGDAHIGFHVAGQGDFDNAVHAIGHRRENFRGEITVLIGP